MDWIFSDPPLDTCGILAGAFPDDARPLLASLGPGCGRCLAPTPCFLGLVNLVRRISTLAPPRHHPRRLLLGSDEDDCARHRALFQAFDGIPPQLIGPWLQEVRAWTMAQRHSMVDAVPSVRGESLRISRTTSWSTFEATWCRTGYTGHVFLSGIHRPLLAPQATILAISHPYRSEQGVTSKWQDMLQRNSFEGHLAGVLIKKTQNVAR